MDFNKMFMPELIVLAHAIMAECRSYHALLYAHIGLKFKISQFLNY
jgi:hypothetical protein